MYTGEIDCKTANKLIPGFLKRTLSLEDKIAFVNHVKNCKECKEELTIQYLVYRGFDEAVSSDNYNLITRLNQEISDAEIEIEERRKRNLINFGVVILALSFIMFVVFILLI